MKENYDYYITQDIKTLKRELGALDFSIRHHRNELEKEISRGNETEAARHAKWIARYTKQRSECALAHDVQVHCHYGESNA